MLVGNLCPTLVRYSAAICSIQYAAGRHRMSHKTGRIIYLRILVNEVAGIVTASFVFVAVAGGNVLVLVAHLCAHIRRETVLNTGSGNHIFRLYPVYFMVNVLYGVVCPV